MKPEGGNFESKAEEARRKLEDFIVEIIEYETPYRHCFEFRNTFWLKYIAHLSCVNFVVYFGLYAILNKLNLFSLIYWLCLYLVLKKNFKPNIFKSQSSRNFRGNIEEVESNSNEPGNGQTYT